MSYTPFLEPTSTPVNVTSLGPEEVVALVVGKRIRVVSFALWCSLNTALEWLSNATVLVEAHDVGPRTQIGDNFEPGYWVQTAVGEPLKIRQAADTPATVRGVVNWVAI